MKVLIPTDKDFNYLECKKLFEETQNLLEDNEKFDDVIKNTFFYSFFVKGRHIGCIYYYETDNKLYVNAVAYIQSSMSDGNVLENTLNSHIINSAPVTDNKETDEQTKQGIFNKLANGLSDFMTGYKENRENGFNPNNLLPEENKGFMQRVGESFGTTARMIHNPIAQGLVAGNSKGTVSLFIDKRCKWLLHNVYNLSFKEGTSIVDVPSLKQIKNDHDLKFLEHPFDAASYLVDYYFPIK